MKAAQHRRLDICRWKAGTPLYRIKRLVSAPTPVSDPNPAMNIPAAIAAAVPPEEPPAILVLSQGFLTAPWQELLEVMRIGQFMKIGLCTGDSAFLEQSLQGRGIFFCGIVERPVPPVVISMDVSILSLIIREVPQAAGLACFNVLIRNACAGFEVFFI